MLGFRSDCFAIFGKLLKTVLRDFLTFFLKVWLPKWKKNTAFSAWFSVRMRIITIVRVWYFLRDCVLKMCFNVFYKFNFRQFCIVFPFFFAVKRFIGSVCVLCFDCFVNISNFISTFFLSFHYFSSLYSQDLIYQSSLVRGNRKKTVQELFAFSCRPL